MQYSTVLDFCNSVRVKLRRHRVTKLVPGKVMNSNECPISRTIGNKGCRKYKVSTGTTHLFIIDKKTDRVLSDIKMPPAVIEFRSNFDMGLIPSLNVELLGLELFRT